MMYKRENKRYVNKQHNIEIILCSPEVHGIYEIIHKNINNMGLLMRIHVWNFLLNV